MFYFVSDMHFIKNKPKAKKYLKYLKSRIKRMELLLKRDK